MNEKIDFVITWVDGSDPVWQAEKAKYSLVGTDRRNARFRDWDQLKYWFRAVEKFAPWVNKIHFVTYGHLPEWINRDNPKLNIVNHKDFIPEQFLPVFNSTAIEVHLHRIPNLSEQFVYFCDDFYLMQPCDPSDFFKNGKPVDMPKIEPIPVHNDEMYFYHLYNDYSLYRKYLNAKKVFSQLFKYVNWKYGKVMVSNMLNLLTKNIYFHSTHLAIPLLKSTMVKLWDDNSEKLEKTASSRFRQITDNSLQLFRGHQLITGNFSPANIKGVVLNTREPEQTKKIIENCPFKLMCLSDNSDDSDFDTHKMLINESFDMIFSERCSFER